MITQHLANFLADGKHLGSANVEVEVIAPKGGRLYEWHGWLLDNETLGVELFNLDSLTIELDDGRRGKCFFKTAGGDGVTFQGSGALQ